MCNSSCGIEQSYKVRRDWPEMYVSPGDRQDLWHFRDLDFILLIMEKAGRIDTDVWPYQSFVLIITLW